MMNDSGGQYSGAGADDECSDTIAGFGFVCESRLDADGKIAWRGPAAYTGVSEVVAGVTSGSSQLNPAERGIRECGATLPCSSGKVWQCLKVDHFSGHFVDTPEPVTPCSRGCGWRFGGWGWLIEQFEGCGVFCRQRGAVQGELEEVLNLMSGQI